MNSYTSSRQDSGNSESEIPFPTHLQSLSHLQLILVREILHQTGDLQPLLGALLQKLERNDLQTMLDSVGDLSRMWTRHFRYRIRLSYSEEVLDLANIIPCVAFHGVPTKTAIQHNTRERLRVTYLITRKSVE